MKIERESQRPDQTPKLGAPLTNREFECYFLISQNGVTPTTTKEIYDEIWGHPDLFILDISQIQTCVGQVVRRIRLKLGEESIITSKGIGYLARKELINYKVAHGFYKNEEK